MIARELQEAVSTYYQDEEVVNKSEAVEYFIAKLKLKKQGKLFIAEQNEYVVRFSFSTKSSFANTVLALKNVLKYDHIPIILCLLKPYSYEFMLVNTTFLKKITHSSQALSLTNIRGSFLGHDIMREVEWLDDSGSVTTVTNEPKYFEQLFALHQSIATEDNIARLVEATAEISNPKNGLIITKQMKENIINSIHYSFANEEVLQGAKQKLDLIVAQCKEELLSIADTEADNVNLRGNKIEQLLTTNGLNQYGLADEIVTLADGGRILIDIKTSIGSMSANAKLYNVDKQLEALADGKTICALYMIHLNREQGNVDTYMLNSFDESILDHLLVQHHWSGRNTRGATQLSARIIQDLKKDSRSRLNIERAIAFVSPWLEEEMQEDH